MDKRFLLHGRVSLLHLKASRKERDQELANDEERADQAD